MLKTKLSWSERFAFIDAYKPSMDQIEKTFGVSAEEVVQANLLRVQGVFWSDISIDVISCGNIFIDSDPNVVITRTKSTNRQKKKPNKRGRRGDKIHAAFENIPSDPVNAYDFIAKYDISLPVLRQAKRFDKTNKIGDIRVKQIINPNTNKKELMVWREK